MWYCPALHELIWWKLSWKATDEISGSHPEESNWGMGSGVELRIQYISSKGIKAHWIFEPQSVSGILSIRNQSLERRMLEVLSICTSNEHSFPLLISMWRSISPMAESMYPRVHALWITRTSPTCLSNDLQIPVIICIFSDIVLIQLASLGSLLGQELAFGYEDTSIAHGLFCSSPFLLPDLENNGCTASLLLYSACFSHHWDGTELSWAMPYYCSSLSWQYSWVGRLFPVL